MLSADDIARRWQTVARYVSALSHEQDDEARGAAFDRVHEHGLRGAGVFGGGFGHEGSTGMSRGNSDFRALQSLEEGFRRLHA